MSRRPSTLLAATWALAAYLGMVLLAAPCSCDAAPAADAKAPVCCCGPNAENPCHAPADGSSSSKKGCSHDLAAPCTAGDDDPAALEAPKAGGADLQLPAPVAVLTVPLGEPAPAQRLRQRSRAPAPPPLRLAQVRSTVLLT